MTGVVTNDDETLETTRIPRPVLLENSGQRKAGPGLGGGHATTQGVSVTQALRVRRKKRRRFTGDYRPSVHVKPAADAAFPAVVSLLFTGPAAVRLWTDGEPFPALGLLLGGVVVTFGLVVLLSRTLDRVDDE